MNYINELIIFDISIILFLLIGFIIGRYIFPKKQ